tara:strand:- start:1023 stop:1199 length:177 start_codon:yes stop_codon:yes gene_type:complete
MSNSINVHSVEKITVDRDEFNSFVATTVTATDNKGNELSFVMYSDDKEVTLINSTDNE